LRTEISALVKRILVGNYDHTHVMLLYILIRSRAGKGITREIADFVAHPERDRGRLHERIWRNNDEISAAIEHGTGKLKVAKPITEEIIVTDLMRVLSRIFPDHKVYIERLREQQQGVQLAVMCMLQGAVFTRKDSAAQISLRWGEGERGNYSLFADHIVQHSAESTTIGVILLERSLLVGAMNRQQTPPFGCYVKESHPTIHML
jgi:hypothetical protein